MVIPANKNSSSSEGFFEIFIILGVGSTFGSACWFRCELTFERIIFFFSLGGAGSYFLSDY